MVYCSVEDNESLFPRRDFALEVADIVDSSEKIIAAPNGTLGNFLLPTARTHVEDLCEIINVPVCMLLNSKGQKSFITEGLATRFKLCI